ncbi:MAG: reprolysin-like metallopeptidase [Burkholderiales bacterium]
MMYKKISKLAGALAFCLSLPLAAAPLFSKVEGSLAANLPAAARSAVVQLDRGAIQTIQVGEELTIAVPGVKSYSYKVLRRSAGGDVNLIEGVLTENANHRMVLGVRAEGVSGVFSTPAGVFSLGYVNGEQWLGMAGSADKVLLGDAAGRPLVFENRIAQKAEKAPVKGAQPVTLNLAALTEMQPGDEALLALPDLGSVRVSYEETRATGESATWIGYLKDFGQDFRVVLTYSPTGTIGHILTPQGEYSIESTALGQTYLVDPRKLGMKRVEQTEGDAVAPLAANGSSTQAGAGADAAVSASTLPGTVVVDVLVLYSPGFVTDKGGVAQAQAAIDHLVALTNQAYIDSGVAMQIRKIGAEQVSVSDTTTNSSVLTDLTNGVGAFSNVKARRDALGADLVSMVRPFYNQYHSGCGIAWIGGYNGTSISGSSAYAYSVVSEGKDRQGSGWYCDITSFAHELGHNQGLMHDRATVASQGGGQGATPYAYGYGISGTFGTIMSYLWPKLGKFSNPNDYTCGGNLRCGIPSTETNSADNGMALNYMKTGVAAFRTVSTTNPPPTVTQVTISGVVTLNGSPRSNVTVSGASCTKTGSNGVFLCTVSAGFTGTLKPSYTRRGKVATFLPVSRSYSDLTANAVNQNFAGTLK